MTSLQIANVRQGLKLSLKQVAEEAFGDPHLIRDVRALEDGATRIPRQTQDALRIYFGRKLRELREKQGLSQKEVADRVGIPQSTVAGWEKFSQEQSSR